MGHLNVNSENPQSAGPIRPQVAMLQYCMWRPTLTLQNGLQIGRTDDYASTLPRFHASTLRPSALPRVTRMGTTYGTAIKVLRCGN